MAEADRERRNADRFEGALVAHALAYAVLAGLGGEFPDIQDMLRHVGYQEPD